MYFDPFSAWLVALIANGIIIADENSRSGTISEYHQKNIEQSNRNLNANIRKIKEKYGITLAEMAYEQIERHVKIIKKSYSFEAAHGQIVIDLENQEYIISVLEECAERFSQYKSVEKYRQKAEWYKNAAIEAKRRKEQYTKELKEASKKESKELEKQKTTRNILIVLIVLVLVIIVINLVFGPKTVAYGNGYSHQIGSFGKCDMNFDNCTVDATHRQHHFFGNDDYCDACWNSYGQDMFERLSGKKTNTNNITQDEFKCRHTGCKNRAKYSEWSRRYCSEHIQGTKYCRYPNCSEQIPINGFRDYCSKHH